MKEARAKQIKRFYALLARGGLKVHKADIIDGFTEGRTTHISDLTPEEVSNLCYMIEKRILPNTTKGDKKERLIRKIYALFRNAGYIYGSSKVDNKINTAKINKFLKEKGAVKKPLYEQSVTELLRTIKQAEAILTKTEYKRQNTALITTLEAQMQDALKSENYEQCALIKEQLNNCTTNKTKNNAKKISKYACK